jgi:tetratricopeptide (TPR) repeat protein
MSPEIFASYSREDQAEVFLIVDKLRERGLNIWIDQEGIHGAKLWSQEIVNAIESSKVFILFASAKAFLSKNVTKELALASESDKHILPIFIEDAEIPSAMKYQLAGIQHLVHEQGQTDQTADNILRTLGNLDIQSTEPQPTAVTTAPATKPASKTPLIAAVLALVALCALFLFRGNKSQEHSTTGEKQLTDHLSHLCVVTNYENSQTNMVSEENRELREKIISKLTRFKDYRIIQGSPVSPDSGTEEYAKIALTSNAQFVLHVFYGRDKHTIRAKAYENTNKTFFWTKSLTVKDVEDLQGEFLDESTSIISAQIAGYDGAVHRWIYENSLKKSEDSLNALELLSVAKQIWEDPIDDAKGAKKALKCIEKSIELSPNNSSAYAVKGQIYAHAYTLNLSFITNGLQLAKKACNKAIQLDSRNGLAHISRLWISMHEKDFEKSKQLVKDAKDINPYEPFLLATIGFYYVFSDSPEPELSKQYIEKAINYNSKPQFWYYMALEEYYMLKNDFQKALELSLKSPELEWRTPAYHWILGDKDIALKKFKEYSSKNPSRAEFIKEELGKDKESKALYLSSNPTFEKASKDLLQAYLELESESKE